MAKKGLNQMKKDLRVFCEKLPFDSLFSSESYVFPSNFLCVLKMYHVKVLYGGKNGVWNDSQTM